MSSRSNRMDCELKGLKGRNIPAVGAAHGNGIVTISQKA